MGVGEEGSWVYGWWVWMGWKVEGERRKGKVGMRKTSMKDG